METRQGAMDCQVLPRRQCSLPTGITWSEIGKLIGEEVSQVLVMVPASFRVRRIIRRKWALKNPVKSDKKGVVIDPIPSRIIQRALFDESMLAHLLTSKFVDHRAPRMCGV